MTATLKSNQLTIDQRTKERAVNFRHSSLPEYFFRQSLSRVSVWKVTRTWNSPDVSRRHRPAGVYSGYRADLDPARCTKRLYLIYLAASRPWKSGHCPIDGNAEQVCGIGTFSGSFLHQVAVINWPERLLSPFFIESGIRYRPGDLQEVANSFARISQTGNWRRRGLRFRWFFEEKKMTCCVLEKLFLEDFEDFVILLYYYYYYFYFKIILIIIW